MKFLREITYAYPDPRVDPSGSAVLQKSFFLDEDAGDSFRSAPGCDVLTFVPKPAPHPNVPAHHGGEVIVTVGWLWREDRKVPKREPPPTVPTA